ncbi:radical SAM protein [Thermosulfidibacter takaii]|nr:radical SAM protein [Thermosulfidibacter takaii]
MPPWRPPSEAYSVLIRVTRGCPWNRCAFCIMYKDIPFEVKSLEEIEQDLRVAREIYGEQAKRLFIGDSDSLVVKSTFLVKVLDEIYEYFPNLQRVTSYTRARTVANRKEEDLRKLRQHGLTRLHMGLESGGEEVLKMVNKGLTPEEAVVACKKALKAGFEVSYYVILGLGGQELSRVHTVETARVLNKANPHFIRLRTLIPVPGSDIYRWIEEGRFKPLITRMILDELITFLEHLESSSWVVADHISNPVYIEGRFPEDKEKILKELYKIRSSVPESSCPTDQLLL